MAARVVKAEDLGKEIAKDMEAMLRGLCNESQERIITKMPSETGAMRASTNLSINSELIQYSETDVDPSGELTKRKNEAKLSQVKVGDVVNIIVGAPYGQVLEEGDANHRPIAFIRSTGEELSAIMRRVKSNLEKYRK